MISGHRPLSLVLLVFSLICPARATGKPLHWGFFYDKNKARSASRLRSSPLRTTPFDLRHFKNSSAADSISPRLYFIRSVDA